jgi:hypothetical protein
MIYGVPINYDTRTTFRKLAERGSSNLRPLLWMSFGTTAHTAASLCGVY